MTMQRKIVRALITPVGDDEVDVVMSTAALARDGHILLPQGCVLDNYRANPIVLWSHNPDHPIGNAENIVVSADNITARARFAQLGISRKADEIRGLAKTGVIRAVSVGFDALEMEPLNPKKPHGGQRITAWELMEFSFVSVPADPGAVVTARQLEDITGDLPVTVKPEIAASTAASTAAATPKPRKRRANPVRNQGPIQFKRGLYQVANLLYLVEELGWHVDMAKYEAAIEGDGSAVPGMLAGVLQDLVDALMAMTTEELSEFMAGYDVEVEAEDEVDDSVVLTVEARAHIAAAPTPAVRAFRRGLAHAKLRAGKTLSDETVRCLKEAAALHEDGMAEIRSGLAKHKKGVAAVNDLMDRAGVADQEDNAAEANENADPSGEPEGEARMSADFRRREAEFLGLAHTH